MSGATVRIVDDELYIRRLLTAIGVLSPLNRSVLLRLAKSVCVCGAKVVDGENGEAIPWWSATARCRPT